MILSLSVILCVILLLLCIKIDGIVWIGKNPLHILRSTDDCNDLLPNQNIAKDFEHCNTIDAYGPGTKPDSEAPGSLKTNPLKFFLAYALTFLCMTVYKQTSLDANKLQYHGTTTLAFVYRDSVVIAVDSMASLGDYVGCRTVRKVLPISQHVVATMAGDISPLPTNIQHEDNIQYYILYQFRSIYCHTTVIYHLQIL